MQHFTEPSASRFVHLQVMQTIPSVVHRFTPAFIKGQETTPELPPVLPFFISHPNSCHTVIEQHHMNAVPLIRKHLHTQILCVLNFLLHNHTSWLSAAKIKREADILCPPPEFISVVDYFIATISQITASHRYLVNSLSSVLKLIVCNQHSLKFLYRFQNL